ERFAVPVAQQLFVQALVARAQPRAKLLIELLQATLLEELCAGESVGEFELSVGHPRRAGLALLSPAGWTALRLGNYSAYCTGYAPPLHRPADRCVRVRSGATTRRPTFYVRTQ